MRFNLPFTICAGVLVVAFFALPRIIALDLQLQDAGPHNSFPVTVNPRTKTITTDPTVEDFLSARGTGLAAAAGQTNDIFTWIVGEIVSIPAYRMLAASDLHFVTINPGFREEEVAHAFGRALNWSTKQQQDFLDHAHSTDPELSEGMFAPGTYTVHSAETPTEVQDALAARFDKQIGSRYSTTTAEQVPLTDALTIASILEREAGDWNDMRLISGIIWNRLFVGMNLQVDATLQYAKASNTTTKSWWPAATPKDKYIKSAYNTYQHAGLPPGPIASPGVAAVLAALNPKQTDCLYYFHDKNGVFHCSKTYEEHVALLKKLYGQGK
jgi:UPF0755 protein